MYRDQAHVCQIYTLPNASILLTACNEYIPSEMKNKDTKHLAVCNYSNVEDARPHNNDNYIEGTCPLPHDLDPFICNQAFICSWETLNSPQYASNALWLTPSPFRPLNPYFKVQIAINFFQVEAIERFKKSITSVRAHVQSLLLKQSLGLT